MGMGENAAERLPAGVCGQVTHFTCIEETKFRSPGGRGGLDVLLRRSKGRKIIDLFPRNDLGG